MADILSHPVPAVIILLGVLVFVHELGHFLVGRWCGIGVEVFSIGFGPKVLGMRFKGTDYRLSALPLGGFVKFIGSTATDPVPEGIQGIPFYQASLAKRLLTVAAGPIANFILAIVAYTVLGSAGIPHPPAQIGDIRDDSPAENAGLQYKDKVVEVNGSEIKTWQDLQDIISRSPAKLLKLKVKRNDGHFETLDLTPDAVEAQNALGERVTIGRAGIAMGALPPVITVLGQQSPAYQSGLRTGDKITAVKFDAEVFAVDYFADFLLALATAKEANASSIEIKVTKAPLPSLDGKKAETATDKTPEERVVPLSIVVTQGVEMGKVNPTSKHRMGKELAKNLGIVDSQLTIGKAGESLGTSLQSGDYLLSWNEKELKDFYVLSNILIENKEAKARLKIMRDGQVLDQEINLEPVEAQRPEGRVTVYRFPVIFWGEPLEPESIIEKYDNPVLALWFGIKQTAYQTAFLSYTVGKLIIGDIPLKSLGGPMLIAKVAGDSAKMGWQAFLTALALVSVNLGLINLFPIPVLDGGQLVMFAIEGIRRKPLGEAAIENYQKIGFVMVMSLVVLATYNDLSRFWKSMLQSVIGN